MVLKHIVGAACIFLSVVSFNVNSALISKLDSGQLIYDTATTDDTEIIMMWPI